MPVQYRSEVDIRILVTNCNIIIYIVILPRELRKSSRRCGKSWTPRLPRLLAKISDNAPGQSSESRVMASTSVLANQTISSIYPIILRHCIDDILRLLLLLLYITLINGFYTPANSTQSIAKVDTTTSKLSHTSCIFENC